MNKKKDLDGEEWMLSLHRVRKQLQDVTKKKTVKLEREENVI